MKCTKVTRACVILPLLIIAVILPSVYSKGAETWYSRSVYQVLTDRFAPPDGSPLVDSKCRNLKKYCGGTWKGIEQNLDYI